MAKIILILLVSIFIFFAHLLAQDSRFNINPSNISDNIVQEVNNTKDSVKFLDYIVSPVIGPWMSAYSPHVMTNDTNFQAGHAYYDSNSSKYMLDYITSTGRVNPINTVTLDKQK